MKRDPHLPYLLASAVAGAGAVLVSDALGWGRDGAYVLGMAALMVIVGIGVWRLGDPEEHRKDRVNTTPVP
jgi:hypothetical protein